MGKFISTVYATKPEQLRKLKSGSVSILMGRNIRNYTRPSSQKPKPSAPPAATAKPQRIGK